MGTRSVEIAQKIRDEGVFGFLRKIDKPKMEEANGNTATVKKRVKSKKKGKHRDSGKKRKFQSVETDADQNLGEKTRYKTESLNFIIGEFCERCVH